MKTAGARKPLHEGEGRMASSMAAPLATEGQETKEEGGGVPLYHAVVGSYTARCWRVRVVAGRGGPWW